MTGRRSTLVAVAALLASASPAALVHAQGSDADKADSSPSVAPPAPVVRVPPPPPIVPPPPPIRISPVPPPAPAPPPRRGLARDPEPLGNPALWATVSDYPRDALRTEQQGTVRFRLTVDPQGRVADCSVTGSSGVVSLDETTCRLMRERALFRSARDTAGKPTVGFYSNSVRWLIPETSVPPPRVPPPEAGGFTISFVVERDGTTTGCEVTGSGFPEQGLDPLTLCPGDGEFQPYKDENGIPVRKRLTTTMRIDVADLPDVPDEAAAPD